jgi:hypothetical protein
MFSKSDLTQIQQHEISNESAKRQQNIIKKNKINTNIVRQVLIADGAFPIDNDVINAVIENFSERLAKRKIVKFVPASGAATRMFKDLFIVLGELSKNKKPKNFTDSVSIFFENLPKFAFFELLKENLKKDNLDIDKLLQEKKYLPILQHLLTEKGLDYGKSPKGLLLFHRYGKITRTALEEHLVEAAGYITENNTVAHLHFTVSPEQMDAFKSHCKKNVPMYEKLFGVTYKIDFSTQHSTTDTIAFTSDNEPFRDKNSNLVFRPGGHGSLIENLNKIDADIILIRNIDNVSLEVNNSKTMIYKKWLICFLICLINQVYEYLTMLDAPACSTEDITKVELFLQKIFFIQLEKSYLDLPLPEKQAYLHRFLNRPMRICGVVEQENEPGGGPFWVKDKKWGQSLQIVETSEINLSNKKQAVILENSNYFNPVDLACCIKNYRGEMFNLQNFIDYSRYFVSEKSHEGKTIKAIENPGLWNGAMSDWLTVFLAVPLSTFTPVKTVNDLLRKEHNY